MTSGPPDVADHERDGLSDSAVRARVARGATNDVPAVATRTVRQIVRSNIFTRFNAILGALLVVILVVEDLRDALFGIVLVANSAIGIVQELRAKRTLDRLVVVTAPAVRVLRLGRWRRRDGARRGRAADEHRVRRRGGTTARCDRIHRIELGGGGDHVASAIGAVAAAFDQHGVRVLGAPEVLLAVSDGDAAIEARVAALAEDGTVFGRVRPQQTEAMVATWQSAGHVVAITGDGVNDVLALKRADLGVAMRSSSPATCAVAQLVLLDDQFAALPRALGQGRRVIGNVDQVARLFLTKSVYSLLLALAVGDVLRFAVPAGSVAAAATFAGYYVTRLLPDANLDEARTTATLALPSVGLLVLARLARPLTTARRMLIGAMTLAMVVVTVVPGLRAFFALDPPPPTVVLAAIGIVAISDRLLNLYDGASAVHRRPPAGDAHPPSGDARPPAPEGAGL